MRFDAPRLRPTAAREIPRAPTVCVDCPRLIATGSRCKACERKRRLPHSRRRASARRRGYDRAWELTRAAYLAEHPGCEDAGCDEQATDVDHLDGLGPRGPRGHDHTNLRARCHPHHSQRTAREHPAGWNQP